MKHYLDIHSHHATAPSGNDIRTVYSLYDDYYRVHDLQACSIGIHPWYIEYHTEKLQAITALASLPQVLAIGECGLDKICATPMALQSAVFGQQIELSNSVRKPLIIHCVRAFTEVLLLLQKAECPVIFHGFNKNPALARQLTDQGYYLSFGAALTQDKNHAIDSLSVIPVDRFFLETDDSTTSVHEIYQAAALIRGITEDELAAQIQQNFQTVFKR